MSDFLSRLAERAVPADSARAAGSTLQPRIRPLFAEVAGGGSVAPVTPADSVGVRDLWAESVPVKVVEAAVFSPPAMPAQGAMAEASNSASAQIPAAPSSAQLPPAVGGTMANYSDISRSMRWDGAPDFQARLEHPIPRSIPRPAHASDFDTTSKIQNFDALAGPMPTQGDGRPHRSTHASRLDWQPREHSGAEGVPTLAEALPPAMIPVRGEAHVLRAPNSRLRASPAESAVPPTIHMRPDAHNLAAQTPRVTIEIGRVEIRAAAAKTPAQSAPVRQAFRPRTSLHDYLNRNPGDDR